VLGSNSNSRLPTPMATIPTPSINLPGRGTLKRQPVEGPKDTVEPVCQFLLDKALGRPGLRRLRKRCPQRFRL